MRPRAKNRRLRLSLLDGTRAGSLASSMAHADGGCVKRVLAVRVRVLVCACVHVYLHEVFQATAAMRRTQILRRRNGD